MIGQIVPISLVVLAAAALVLGSVATLNELRFKFGMGTFTIGDLLAVAGVLFIVEVALFAMAVVASSVWKAVAK